jgi:hypothetical protein
VQGLDVAAVAESHDLEGLIAALTSRY